MFKHLKSNLFCFTSNIVITICLSRNDFISGAQIIHTFHSTFHISFSEAYGRHKQDRKAIIGLLQDVPNDLMHR